MSTAPAKSAVDLKVAGLVPFSTVDWPGKLCASLFLQGCPWRCPYCHNSEILEVRAPGTVPWVEVEDLLERRCGLLDGIVFSGGEALVQASSKPGSPLEDALRKVRELGYQTGLHTGGAYPSRLKYLLEQGLIDWVGLDIKALPSEYQLATGSSIAAERAAESLAILADYDASRGGTAAHFSWEVRLTLWPVLAGSPEPSSEELLDYAYQVASWSRAHGARRFALQRYQAPEQPQMGVDPALLTAGPRWDEEEARLRLEDLGLLELAIR